MLNSQNFFSATTVLILREAHLVAKMHTGNFHVHFRFIEACLTRFIGLNPTYAHTQPWN